MKSLILPFILMNFLGLTSQSYAETISYRNFNVTFKNSGETFDWFSTTYTSSKNWNDDEIAVFKRSIDTWADVITNTPGKQINVICMWSNIQALGVASSPIITVNDKTFGANTEMSAIEHIWRNEQSNYSHYSPPAADLFINFNSDLTNLLNNGATYSWFTGSGSDIANNKYDLQSVMTHEIGHSLGFASSITAPSNSFTTPKTAFDFLMSTSSSSLISPTSHSLGETYYIGSDGLKVYNPATWEQGSSMSHLTSDDPNENFLMLPNLYNGEIARDLSWQEINLLRDMGWEIIPEPSTATISILALSSLLLRRRRVA